MPIQGILYIIIFGVVTYMIYLAMPLLESLFSRWQKKKLEKITPKLDQMFLDVPLKKLMLIDVLSPIITAFIGYFLIHNWVFALISGACGFVVPVLIVKRMEAVRRQKFSSQLVDGLMILTSSLKAGLSLPQAFEALVEEMPAPISQEFSLVLRQIQMGVSLEQAIYTLKKRMRIDELDLVVTAIMIARETGGNLTEIFAQVAYTIQERNKLFGKVNALCVQAKLQGAIMSLLPVCFGLFVYRINPHFFDIFIKDAFGRFLLGYAIVSQILGVFFIRKFSKVDV
jgi:tight adherence protein B